MKTDDTPKHTPTPWICYEAEDEKFEIGQENKPDKPLPTRVAIIPYNDEEGEANAAFIVKACNGYEKAIEALSLAKKALDEAGIFGITIIDEALKASE